MASLSGSQERQTRSSAAAAAAQNPIPEPSNSGVVVDPSVREMEVQEVVTIEETHASDNDGDGGEEFRSADEDDSDSNEAGGDQCIRYKQRYLSTWEFDSRLKEWLTACPGDEYAAFCNFCQCKLHAHKKGLVVHAKSHKHKRHKQNPAPPNPNFNWASAPLNSCQIQNHSESLPLAHTSHDTSANLTGELDEDYLRKMRKRQFRRDTNVFQEKWLSDPCFSAWIRRVPKNPTKALCVACRCLITSGRSELRKHTKSQKHKKAILEGPFEELPEERLQRLFPDLYDPPCKEAKKRTYSRPVPDPGIEPALFNLPTIPYSERYITQMRPSSVVHPGMLLSEVLKRLETHVPLFLAEKWDNVGVITKPVADQKVYHILLTNDLNEKISQEAISRRAQLIISYHPPVFSPIKKLNPSSWKERALLLCIENKIAVYSPHTALDAISGGINDWLISPFLISQDDTTRPITYSVDDKYTSSLEVRVSENQDQVKQAFMNMSNVRMTEYGNLTDICVDCNSKTLPEAVERLAQNSQNSTIHSKYTQLVPPPLPGLGMGRIATLQSPLPLYEVVQRTKTHLDLNQVRLALSPKHTRDTRISKIAVCAGSGSSVLKGCAADMWITGEMSHHDVLDAIHNGVSVILCEHSNTERGFFRDWSQQLKTAIFEEQVEVLISDLDKDPLKII